MTTHPVLSTNSGNPSALKVLAVARMSKLDVALEFVDLPPENRLRPHRLPFLTVERNVELFCTNAAVSYLLEVSGLSISSSLQNLMSFDSLILSPFVFSYLGDKSDGDRGVVQELSNSIQFIEDLLVKSKFLGGQDKPTVEDAVIWSCLYPLLASKDPIVSSFSKILTWFEQISLHDPFKYAVKQLHPTSGKEAIKSILAYNPTALASSFGDRSKKGSDVKTQVVEKAEAGNNNLLKEDIDAARKAWAEPLPAVDAKSKGPGRILPLAGQKNYLVTSALPYVNNVPHLGNIIGCVLSADVFARYLRLRGRNVLYICGTDEYGTATETKALEEKLTPQQICDKYHKLHTEIYKWFQIEFDYFGRTTTEEQTKVGQDIFRRLYSNGYLKEMVVLQLYCTPCQRFLSDRFVEGTCPVCGYDDARGDQCDKCGRLTNSTELKNPRCKVCNSQDVVTKNSDQVFLDLPKLEELEGLAEWLEEASESWTPNARHIAKSWMKEGLKERCITRDLKWGTPVPLEKYKDKVFYVWFDAPIGYISMTASYTSYWKSWWINPDMDIDYYQFMAKDNVPFHSILFPASLRGTKQPWTLVRHIIATEYLNYEDGKFSKSRGVGVFGSDAVETGIPADIWRFYLIYMRPETQDSAFCWDDFMTKNNSELLNNLGNFVNRSLTFLEKFFESTVPEMNLIDEDFQVVAQINTEIAEYIALLELCKLRDALRKILCVSRIGNVYFQSQKPWTLNKNDDDRDRCGTICGLGAQIVFLLMVMLDPFMPGVGKQIRGQLNVLTPIFSTHLLPFLPSGHKIGKVSPLFQKLEADLIDTLRKRYAGLQNDRPVSVKAQKSPTKGKPQVKTDLSIEKLTNGNDKTASPEEIAALEADVAWQANIVRGLKTSKADKPLVDAEVAKLLQLKRDLLLKQGKSPDEPSAGKGKGSKKK